MVKSLSKKIMKESYQIKLPFEKFFYSYLGYK